MDPLVEILRKVRVRLAVVRWVRFTVDGLTAAVCVAFSWVLVTRLFPALGSPMVACLGTPVLALTLASALAIVRRPTLLASALETDRRLGYEERLTSSYQLAEREGEMVEALHRDARAHVDGVSLSRDFPLRAPRSIRWLPVALVALGASWFVPEIDLLGYREKVAAAQREQAATKMKAERLKAAARPLRELVEKDEDAAELSGVAEEIERIAEGLEVAELTDKQALARLSKLGRELMENQDELAESIPMPKMAADSSELGAASDIAKSIEQGDFAKAAEELRKLQESIKSEMAEGSGEGEQGQGEMAKELEKLAEMLGGEDSELGKALAEAAEQLRMESAEGAMDALAQMNVSLEDLASALEQMAVTEMALGELREAGDMLLGERGQFGELAGRGFGAWSSYRGFQSGNRRGEGPGMRGPGRGAGNTIGDLPDVEVSFDPTVAPGEMTRGKVLATIMQRAAPDEDVESTIEMVNQAFVEVQQEAEQALTKEEIPPGARELVRQYFGSIEPEK